MSLTELSAAELFELANQRKKEEELAKTAHIREELAQLKADKASLVAEHKKALSSIERQIKKLQKKVGQTGASSGEKTRGLSKSVIEFIETKGQASVSDIKQHLTEQGLNATNVGQQLAYLKRQGRVSIVTRGIYALTA